MYMKETLGQLPVQPGVNCFSLCCRGYDGSLRVGILPVALFASGHTYFVQRLHEQMGLEPFAVHATFQYSGTPGKRHRMRERMLWLAVRNLPL